MKARLPKANNHHLDISRMVMQISYWSAMPSSFGHAVLGLNVGSLNDVDDSFNFSVTLQVL